jgi:hypothetical protein
MFKISKNTGFIITVFVLSLTAVVLVLLHSFGYAVDHQSLLSMRYSAVGIVGVLTSLYIVLALHCGIVKTKEIEKSVSFFVAKNSSLIMKLLKKRRLHHA